MLHHATVLNTAVKTALAVCFRLSPSSTLHSVPPMLLPSFIHSSTNYSTVLLNRALGVPVLARRLADCPFLCHRTLQSTSITLLYSTVQYSIPCPYLAFPTARYVYCFRFSFLTLSFPRLPVLFPSAQQSFSPRLCTYHSIFSCLTAKSFPSLSSIILTP